MEEKEEDQKEKEKPKMSQANWWKVGFIVLLFLVVSTTAFLSGLYFSQKEKKETLEPTKDFLSNSTLPTTTEIAEPTQAAKKTGIVSNKIFYSKENNVYSYDVVSKETSQWTNFSKNPDDYISYQGIRVRGEDSIVFGKCETKIGDFGCGLYIINLKTKDILEKKKFGPKDMLSIFDFYDNDKFAYLIMPEQKWQLFVEDSGNVKNLEDAVFLDGRGGFIEDSNKMRFSPDGKYLLHISTSSPRDIQDFNVYIYNLLSDAKQVIQDATQPEWLDSKNIVFRKYKEEGDGLYIYNLETKTEEKIENIEKDTYHPEVVPEGQKIIYEKYGDKQIWLYDLKTKAKRQVADQALSGFFVSPTVSVYTKIKPCGDNCMGMFDYNEVGIEVYDLEKDQLVDTFSVQLFNSYTAATLYH